MSRNLFEYHPGYGHRFIPAIRARVDHEGGGYLVAVNRAGFRCRHEFVRERAAGRCRLLLFGDSYTAGDGVSNKERFGDVLEAIVPNLDVYNFGLPGSGTDQQYLVFAEFGPVIEHDIVVIAVMVENIVRVASRYRLSMDQDGRTWALAKPFFVMADDGALTLHNVPVPKDPVPVDQIIATGEEHAHGVGRHRQIRQAVNALGPRVKDLAQRLTRYQPLPAYDSPKNREWGLLKAILAKWVSESKTPVIIFPIPVYQYVEETASPTACQERFAELSGVTGVSVHDPLPDLLRVPMGERRRFRFEHDQHPTPAGHRALAESLARVVAPLAAAVTQQP